MAINKLELAYLRLHKFWYQFRFHLSNLIFKHNLPFYIAYTKKLDVENTTLEYPPIPDDYNVLAEFDLPNSDRHYIIYVMKK